MGDDIVQLSFRIAMKVFKPLIGILFRTGLIYPMALSLVQELMGPGVIPTWLYILALVLCNYLFFQSIVRLVKKDKKLKLYNLLLGRSQSREERLSTRPKVNKSLLFSEPTGFVFGRYKGKWVCRDESSSGHIAICGGPGSGKSASCGICSLLSWGKNSNDPVFAIDIKGELYAKTKHQRPNSKVFSLTLPEAYGFNPFYLIDEKGNIIEQIKSIADILIPIPPDTKDPFWKNSSRNYLTACLVWAWEVGCPFAEIMRLIQITPPDEMIAGICGSKKEKALLFANQFRSMPSETLAGIFGETCNAILPFATDDQLRAALSKPKEKCISPEDLNNGTSIYLCLEEYKLEALRQFLTLIVGQFLRAFEQRTEGENTRVLFLLDEFPRLGKLEVLSGLATLRSKNVAICLIFQSLAQLDLIYGRDQRKAIIDNCGFIGLLKVSDPESQKYFADAIGTYDKTKKSYSDNQQDLNMFGSSGTSTTTEEKRRMKPEDLNQLTDELILISGYGFNRIKKSFYFKEPYFQKLLNAPRK